MESGLFKVCFPLENFERIPVEAGIKKNLRTFWKNTHHLEAMKSNLSSKAFDL